MDRHTPYRDGQLFAVPVAAATELFGGHIIGGQRSGFCCTRQRHCSQYHPRHL